MISSLWKSNDSLDHQLPSNNDDSLMGRLGLRAVLVFCSGRALRGGPRLVVQISIFLLTILLLFHLLPDRLAGSGFASSYKNYLPWSSTNLDVSGNLRIVVFGSPDLVGSATDGSARRSTWTEQLCNELNCSSHISFVPTESDRGLLSNSIYDTEFQSLLNITEHTDITKKPASDYNFIAEQYPVPADTPDLAAQIQKFLAMPAPKVPPRETLWIFSFGTWDIWNLAAMPKDSGNSLVDAMVKNMFEQIELLYTSALDPKSVAFSDFWSNITDAQIEALTAVDAAEKIDERRLESFRVLIPKLFDISLAPGWQSRPLPTIPNSMAEQTRKASALTARWNSEVRSQMDGWKKKASTKPEDLMGQPDHLVEVVESNTLLKYMPAALRPSMHKDEDTKDDPVIYAPYPRRTGLQADQAGRILDAMTEEEMQRAGVRDSKGRGTLSVNDTMRFLDVWTPCLKVVTPEAAADANDTIQECDNIDNHLFLDSFTVGQRAIKGVAKSTAKEVLEHLFIRKEEKASWLSRRGSEKSFIRKLRL